MTESKRITGTELFWAVQDGLNDNIEFVTKTGWINWILIDRRTGCGLDNVSINLMEYRRLYSLCESLGADMDNHFNVAMFWLCEFDDFDMCAEWMRWYRNKNSDFNSDLMVFINKYAEKFDLDVIDMFKFMFNDDDGEYLKHITKYLTDYPDYPTYFPDDHLYPEPNEGRHFDIMSEDVEELIAGKLIV